MYPDLPHRKARIKIAQFGLGPIGRACLQLLAEKPWAEIVGAVDIDPGLEGKDVAGVCGLGRYEAGRVHSTFGGLCAEARPDVVLHTAGSRAAEAFRQCRPVLESGVSVVSSCEELLFPWHRAPAEAAEAGEICRSTGARILGTGVNPGFVFDLLPATLLGVCRQVRGVRGRRVVDASLRRQPLQKKIGSGQDPEVFRGLWKQGKAGHAGFQESLLLLAHALGWKTGPVTETLEPVVAERDLATEFFRVKAGQTRGLHQTVRAESKEGFPIVLELTMALDEPDPEDWIRLDSDPPVTVRVEGGISGDRATVASLVNAVPRLLACPAGIRLVIDLPAAAPGGVG